MRDTTRGHRRATHPAGDVVGHDRRHRRMHERGDHRDHRRGGGRARRGDVRAAVLTLLGERPMHGYEMIQELETRTGGVWKPSPGSVYPTLSLLEDEGLITSETEGGKKLFTLTAAGTEAQSGTTEAPWASMVRDADPAQLQLRVAVHSVHEATRQVALIGTDEQKARAVELVEALRKELYLLLAG